MIKTNPSCDWNKLIEEIDKMNDKLKTYILAILAVIYLSGCSAQYHMRRAVKLDPTIIDTVVRYDTVFIEIDKVDTVFKYNFDTVEYWQDKVFIKYHFDTLTNDVYISADCPDSEIITKEIIKTIRIEPTIWEVFKYIAYVFFTVVFLQRIMIKKRL